MGATLIVGKSGQLAQAIAHLGGAELHFRGGQDHDFFDTDATARLIADLGITRVISTAAYTAVDKAESEPEAAKRLNADLPRILARTCGEAGAQLVHVSTDYVFDGQLPASQAYAPGDATAPLNVYGQTKLAGEQAVLETLADARIVRTSWVISQFGKNFLKTMAHLMAEGRDLRVVNDQYGTPTLATDLARHLLTGAIPSGISHHATGPQQTWFDIAQSIHQALNATGRLDPIPTSEYPTPAKRGRNTSLIRAADADHYHGELAAALRGLARG